MKAIPWRFTSWRCWAGFPLGGETFRENDLEIKVESITGRRIRKVRVRRLPPVQPDEDGMEQKSEEPCPITAHTEAR